MHLIIGQRAPECGCRDSGGHTLFGTAVAMHLLRQGTPLKTIGDLLGHRSVESTGTYLRLQIDDLSDVARFRPNAARR
ncbi:MAG TPA: tyrosine-type recombinase/integrase [Bryobacteraceae bacterium]|nr:tyrosine-type recombinase/integrase [Bryobacteraceae bacterium]